MRCGRRDSTIELDPARFPGVAHTHNRRAVSSLGLEQPQPDQLPELTWHGRIAVTPRLDAALIAIDNEAKRQGGRITWVSGYRTRAQQTQLRHLWAAGDPGVPFEPLSYEQSKHSTGQAADGEASSPQLAAHLGAYAQELGLRWSPIEPWHFELRSRAAEVGR